MPRTHATFGKVAQGFVDAARRSAALRSTPTARPVRPTAAAIRATSKPSPQPTSITSHAVAELEPIQRLLLVGLDGGEFLQVLQAAEERGELAGTVDVAKAAGEIPRYVGRSVTALPPPFPKPGRVTLPRVVRPLIEGPARRGTRCCGHYPSGGITIGPAMTFASLPGCDAAGHDPATSAR